MASVEETASRISDPQTSARSRLSVELRAVIADLDGVVTDTASLHFAAWTETFNDFLARATSGAQVQPFTAEDYRRNVDGRPRADGVAAFLASRGTDLPLGDPADDPGKDTIIGLAKRKDIRYLALLRSRGPGAFPSSLAFIRSLRTAGAQTALVTASRHGNEVLQAAGIQDLFDARVDGFDIERMRLAGKPHPDTFLEAARRLSVPPSEAAVVEDALAGVEAGRRGRFALVIGVNRTSQREDLLRWGADMVVRDLGELVIEAVGSGRVRLRVRVPGDGAADDGKSVAND